MKSAVACKICGHAGHILMPHLKQAHGLTALAYAQAHPGEPVLSDLGVQLVERYAGGTPMARPTRWVPFCELFGGDNPLPVEQHVGPARYIPLGSDAGYQYDYDCTLGLIMAWSRPQHNAVWLTGSGGSGKSSLVRNVARKLGREVIHVGLDSAVTRSELIGDWGMRDGVRRFVHGLLPVAMRRGAILVLDAFDVGDPSITALLRPALEVIPRLVLVQNDREIVEAHPDFRVVATCRSWGSGRAWDGTNSLALTDRQRFSVFLQIAGLPADAEQRLLLARVPTLEPAVAKQMVQVAATVRTKLLHDQGHLGETLSARQLVNWAECYTLMGHGLRAAAFTFLRPLGVEKQRAIREIITHVGKPLVTDEELGLL